MDDVTRVLHVTVMQGTRKMAISVLVRKLNIQPDLVNKLKFIYNSCIIACTAGQYRSALNSSCVDCPANSNSLSAASETCSCNAGYYRVNGSESEGIGVECTGKN